MADNENLWTQEIDDTNLAELLNRAATSGHPEWDYHVRHGLSEGSMTEKQAAKYLEDCFSGKSDDDEDDDEPEPKATKATKKS